MNAAVAALADHYDVFRRRMSAVSREQRGRVLSSYERVPRDKRHFSLLYWPLLQQHQFAHIPLYRVPVEQYAEYFYFGFLCHYLRYHYDAAPLARPRRQPPPPKPTGPLVRLLDWTAGCAAVPADLLSSEALAPTDMDAACVDGAHHYYHWEAKPIHPRTHKAYFTLRQPRLSMCGVTYTRVQLYHQEPVRLVASNCLLLISNVASCFRGVTIYLPGQLCPVELPVSSFRQDADGQRTLDLATLGAPDQLCYLDTHGSQLTLVFGAEPGTLRLCAGCATGGREIRCGLDIGACDALEYWSPDPLLQPSRYVIADAERLDDERPSDDHAHPGAACALCETYLQRCRAASTLWGMRVDWIGTVPFFFIDGEPLAVMETPGAAAYGPDGVPLNHWWTLYWRAQPIAYVALNPPYSDYNMEFRMILPHQVHLVAPFRPELQYVY